MKAKIYHNPHCSKSRAALALLQERHFEIDIVDYLTTPPDIKAIEALLAKLGLSVRDIIRRNEPEFQDSGLMLNAPEEELIKLLARHPRLLERPIVEIGARARIGRPPERLLEIIP
jgi:arsenate reductase